MQQRDNQGKTVIFDRHHRGSLVTPLAVLTIASFLLLLLGAVDSETAIAKKPNWAKKTKAYKASAPSYDAMFKLRLAESYKLWKDSEKTCEIYGFAFVRNLMQDHRTWWQHRAQAKLRQTWKKASGKKRSCNWVAGKAFRDIAEKKFPGLHVVATWVVIKDSREKLLSATREIVKKWVKGSTCGDVWNVTSNAAPVTFSGAALAFGLIGRGLGRYCRP